MIGYIYIRKAMFGKTTKKKIATLVEMKRKSGTFYDNGNTCYIDFRGNVEDVREQDLISKNLNRVFEEYINRELTQEEAAVQLEAITGIKIGLLRKPSFYVTV